jgi:hypothetical protein
MCVPTIVHPAGIGHHHRRSLSFTQRADERSRGAPISPPRERSQTEPRRHPVVPRVRYSRAASCFINSRRHPVSRNGALSRADHFSPNAPREKLAALLGVARTRSQALTIASRPIRKLCLDGCLISPCSVFRVPRSANAPPSRIPDSGWTTLARIKAELFLSCLSEARGREITISRADASPLKVHAPPASRGEGCALARRFDTVRHPPRLFLVPPLATCTRARCLARNPPARLGDILARACTINVSSSPILSKAPTDLHLNSSSSLLHTANGQASASSWQQSCHTFVSTLQRGRTSLLDLLDRSLSRATPLLRARARGFLPT